MQRDRTAEVLEGALALIEVGWCRGKLEDEDGNYCLLGAVDRAAALLGVKFSAAYAELSKAVDLLSDGLSISQFNDVTDFESIRLAFKHAIREAEERLNTSDDGPISLQHSGPRHPHYA